MVRPVRVIKTGFTTSRHERHADRRHPGRRAVRARLRDPQCPVRWQISPTKGLEPDRAERAPDHGHVLQVTNKNIIENFERGWGHTRDPRDQGTFLAAGDYITNLAIQFSGRQFVVRVVLCVGPVRVPTR